MRPSCGGTAMTHVEIHRYQVRPRHPANDRSKGSGRRVVRPRWPPTRPEGDPPDTSGRHAIPPPRTTTPPCRTRPRPPRRRRPPSRIRHPAPAPSSRTGWPKCSNSAPPPPPRSGRQVTCASAHRRREPCEADDMTDRSAMAKK